MTFATAPAWDEEFKGDAATLEWLEAQKVSTRYGYKWAFKQFLDKVEMTGDEIIADRKNDKVFKWEKIVYDAKIACEREMSSNSAKKVGTSARSFFSYHRMPLKFRRQESKRLIEAHTENEDYRFSIEDLRRMYDVADLTEKYVLTLGKSIGLRDGDFVALTRGDLEPYIDRETPVSIGVKVTGKENVPAYPFLDADAVEIVKLVLQQMNREGRTDPSEKMFTNRKNSKTTLILNDLAERAGIVTGGKRVRFHNLRKFLIDRLSAFMSESKWKQIVGKKISEGAYVSTEMLRERYIVAMKEFAIKKANITGDVGAIIKKQVLLMFAKNVLKLKEDEVKEHLHEAKNLDEEITLLEGLMNPSKPAKIHACADGQHCQRIVSENELPAALAQGWKVTAVLPSGKIVVDNEH